MLAVRKNCGFSVQPLGEPSDYAAFAVLSGGTTVAGRKVRIVAGSVYLATGTNRRVAREEVMRQLRRHLERFPDTQVIIGGDFNTKRGTLVRMLHNRGIGMTLAETQGRSPITSAGV